PRCLSSVRRPFLLTPPPTPQIHTLSLHDALPIFARRTAQACGRHHAQGRKAPTRLRVRVDERSPRHHDPEELRLPWGCKWRREADRKSTRLNSSHVKISYAVFCLKKKKQKDQPTH